LIAVCSVFIMVEAHQFKLGSIAPVEIIPDEEWLINEK
jgi:hypothetical protein